MTDPPACDVLVLGSKPGARLPAIVPAAIYTANGAAARIAELGLPAPVPTTCVAAAGAIDLPHDRSAIVAAAPERIVIRKDNARAEHELHAELPRTEIVNLSRRQQWRFQRRIIGRRLLWAELQYDPDWPGRLRRFRKFVRRGFTALGASTGLYAVLLAAHEWPDARIVLAGIGAQSGGHFYDHAGKPHGQRANVDAWLFPRLPEPIRRRLHTTDEPLSELARIGLC